MMKLRLPSLLALGLTLTVWVFPAWAEEPAAVLDHDGRLYRLQTGTYGTLFAGGAEAATNAPVLALDILDPDGTERRLLVAGTGDAAREEVAQLVLEETSQTPYVVWERLPAKGAEEVRVVGLEGETWGTPVTLEAQAEITATPQLRVTRDSFLAGDGKGGSREVVRTALHLLWAEAATDGEAVLYAPVILEDGVNRSPAPRVVLNDFGSAATAGEPIPEGLRSSPTLERGSDDRSVVAGFVDVATGRQLTLELRMLPYALGGLALQVERYILDEGALTQGPGGLESLAGGVGGMIIETGRELHPSVRFYFAALAQDAVLEQALGGDGPGVVLQNLAGGVGGMIIEVGSRLFGSDGLDRNYVDSRLNLVEVPRTEAGETVASHMVRIYVTSDRPAPAVGAGVEASLLVSGDGERGLVCWEAGGALLYRESEGAGWTGVRSLPMGAELNREQAQQLLRQRLQVH